MNKSILDILYANSDKKYRTFQSALIPMVDAEKVIGVRTPILRKTAKEIANSGKMSDFIGCLPHRFFEENQLHAFILSEIKDFDTAVNMVDKFLPYIDNWATCDQMSPKSFVKNADKLLPYINKWIKSKHTYTVRFGVLCLMRYFLDVRFDKKYLDIVGGIKSNEYYVNMVRAWYFATALAKQYDVTLEYLRTASLDCWTPNKAIQKAVESYRISDAHKAVLRRLRHQEG